MTRPPAAGPEDASPGAAEGGAPVVGSGGGAPVVAVGGVAVVGGCVLLVRRANDPQAGRWTIPGGRVEPGEPLASAVERELFEETGLVVRCGPFLGWAERIGPGHHFVILDFTVHVAEGEPDLVPGSDATGAAWVPLAQLHTVELVDGVEEFLLRHPVAG